MSLRVFKVGRHFHGPINTPARDTQTPPLGCKEHLQKCKSKTDGTFQGHLFCFSLACDSGGERRQRVRPKPRPEPGCRHTWHARRAPRPARGSAPGGEASHRPPGQRSDRLLGQSKAQPSARTGCAAWRREAEPSAPPQSCRSGALRGRHPTLQPFPAGGGAFISAECEFRGCGGPWYPRSASLT